MARAACKIIINGGVGGLIRAIEKVLTDPSIHAGKIPELDRYDLIQRLADVDLAAYGGGEVSEGGVSGILLSLEKYGLVTDEVWQIFRKP